MTDKKSFGNFIKAKRLEKNYSQKELAELLYVTESAVSKWERGVSYPDVSLITDICRALDLSEHELLSASVDTNARKEKYEAKVYRKIARTWFWIPTICYIITIITCFICNLAINNTLSWFWVVLASLLCAYSFVPTFTSFFSANKLLVFTITSLSSICLLLLVCAIFTGTIYWVSTACFGTAIGYAFLFVPILIHKSNVSDIYKRLKFLISFVSAFVLTIALLAAVNVWNEFALKPSLLMTVYGYLPLILCAVLCLSHFNNFIKAGLCTLIAGAACYAANYMIEKLFFVETGDSYIVNFLDWENCVNGNVQLIILLSVTFIGMVLIGIGVYRRQHSAITDIVGESCLHE